MDFDLSPELRMLQESMREFVKRELTPLEGKYPEDDDIPPEVRRDLEAKVKGLGLWNLTLPEEFEGGGFGHLGTAVIELEIGGCTVQPFRSHPIFGNSLRVPYTLFQCTPEQREKYLWPVVRGEKRICFGLTEASGGSDPISNMRTTARPDGDYWVINGTKIFITDAQNSDICQVVAITDKEKGAKGGLTMFLVETGTPGYTIAQKMDLMIPDKPAELVFADCRVHKSQVLGQVGGGWEMAQAWLTAGRIRHSAHCLGIGFRALQMATEYAKTRNSFGKPIAERQAVQWMLADSAMELHAARLALLHACWKLDNGQPARNEVPMVKVLCNEAAWQACDRAIQIYGGMGLSRELPLERMWREMRSALITEGPVEVHRMTIAKNLLSGRNVLDLV